MDANAIARALMAEMSDAVHRRYHPRSGVLVPTRLTGQHPVPTAKLGEKALDQADELLETECETWPLADAPDISLDLCKDKNGWVVSWVIDSEPEQESESDALEEGQETT